MMTSINVNEYQSVIHSINALSDYIEKTDEDSNLAIFSYKQCDNSSREEVKMCRGMVVDLATKIPLFRSLGYATEYTEASWAALPLSPEAFGEMRFYASEEGTLLRLFFSKSAGKWYLATHRKLDAFRSRWSSGKPFGEMFETALFRQTGMMLADLTMRIDPAHVYLFLVRSSQENRVVCIGANEPTMFHVGTLRDGQHFDTETEVAGIQRPVRLPFTRQEEVSQYAAAVNPATHQGVIGFSGDGRHCKIVNSHYAMFSQVRGNEPSVAFRYLQVRTNPVYSKMMYDLYPEHVARFMQYETTILTIAKRIHNAYIARFIKKRQAVVTPEEYRIVRECHGWHISDRVHNRVTLAVVTECLSQAKFASTVNAIIRAELNPKKVEVEMTQ